MNQTTVSEAFAPERMALAPCERIIIDAELGLDASSFRGVSSIRRQLLDLAEQLRGTGVYFRPGSLLAACGYDLLQKIFDCGLKPVVDLLSGSAERMMINAAALDQFGPSMVIVPADAGVAAFRALKVSLPKSEVVAALVPSHLTKSTVHNMYATSSGNMSYRLSLVARESGIDGLIATPMELTELWQHHRDDLTLNIEVDRNRVDDLVEHRGLKMKPPLTPAEAIKLRATRVILAESITRAPSPLDALNRNIAEIKEVLK